MNRPNREYCFSNLRNTLRFTFLLLLSIYSVDLFAQREEGFILNRDNTSYNLSLGAVIQPDTTLFSLSVSEVDDLYSALTRYYQPGGGSGASALRGGVAWWIARDLDTTIEWGSSELQQPLSRSTVRVSYGGQASLMGISANYSHLFGKGGWALDSSVSYRTGRNQSVDGLFADEIYPMLSLSKSFDSDRYLALTLKLPYTERGLRSATTQECYDLTANPNYNPSWGYYNGEVRNSRVARNFRPSMELRYQQPLSSVTTMALEAEAYCGSSKYSCLGWYNASNPMPDYYNKMPSWISPTSDAYDIVKTVWQSNDTNYTQINWAQLERYNAQSSDGEAHYTLEDRVSERFDIELRALFSSQLSRGVKLNYGVEYNRGEQRNFKELRDLLGADYLLDVDQWVSDYSSVSNNLQNNLRDPNRRVKEGDEFGYNYSFIASQINFLMGIDLVFERFSSQFTLSGGSHSLHREGHYEKERFAGGMSYGKSQELSMDDYTATIALAYTLRPKQTLSLRATTSTRPPLASSLFVDEQNANTIVTEPKSQAINSLSLGYSYRGWRVNFDARLRYISVGDGLQSWQLYDDLSANYCNVVISDIATTSMSAEVAASLKLSSRLTINSTINVGSYTYSGSPLVTLYDYDDMSHIASSRATGVEGCVVGNTPQIAAALWANYYAPRGYILNFNSSLLASRYIAPSIVRRTARMESYAPDDDIWEQEVLDNIFDVSISVTKIVYFKDSRRMVARISVENLLSSGGDVVYGREGNRILSRDYGGVEYSTYAQPSLYEMSQGRSIYLSLAFSL